MHQCCSVQSGVHAAPDPSVASHLNIYKEPYYCINYLLIYNLKDLYRTSQRLRWGEGSLQEGTAAADVSGATFQPSADTGKKVFKTSEERKKQEKTKGSIHCGSRSQ